MSNLIQQTQILWQQSGSISAGLRAMNAALGACYSLTRWGDWRRGTRPVPEPVQIYCRELVADWMGQPELADIFNPPGVNR